MKKLKYDMQIVEIAALFKNCKKGYIKHKKNEGFEQF